MIEVAELIKMAGGPSALARVIGTTRQAVHNWRNVNRVPAEYAWRVALVTGVDVEEVRPGLTKLPEPKS